MPVINRQRALRKELRKLSHLQLLDRAKSLDDPLLDGLGSDAPYDDILQAVWQGVLRRELTRAVRLQEESTRHAILLKRARSAGVPEEELIVPKEKLESAFLETKLKVDSAALASNELHPTYDALLTLLSDPFLQYIVVPQLLLL